MIAQANAPRLSDTQRRYTGGGTPINGGTAAISTSGAPPTAQCDTSILNLVALNPTVAASIQNNPEMLAKVQEATRCQDAANASAAGARAAVEDVPVCVKKCMDKFRADNGLPSEADAAKQANNGGDFVQFLQLMGNQGQGGNGQDASRGFYEGLPGTSDTAGGGPHGIIGNPQ